MVRARESIADTKKLAISRWNVDSQAHFQMTTAMFAIHTIFIASDILGATGFIPT